MADNAAYPNPILQDFKDVTSVFSDFAKAGAEAYATFAGAKYLKNIDDANSSKKVTLADLTASSDGTVKAVGLASYAIAALAVVGVGVLVWKELK
jgi:hypothetical protein